MDHMEVSPRENDSATFISDAILVQCDDLGRRLGILLDACSSHSNSHAAVVLSDVALAIEIWRGEVHSDYSHDGERSPLQRADIQILDHVNGAFTQALREVATIEVEIIGMQSLGVSSRAEAATQNLEELVSSITDLRRTILQTPGPNLPGITPSASTTVDNSVFSASKGIDVALEGTAGDSGYGIDPESFIRDDRSLKARAEEFASYAPEVVAAEEKAKRKRLREEHHSADEIEEGSPTIDTDQQGAKRQKILLEGDDLPEPLSGSSAKPNRSLGTKTTTEPSLNAALDLKTPPLDPLDNISTSQRWRHLADNVVLRPAFDKAVKRGLQSRSGYEKVALLIIHWKRDRESKTLADTKINELIRLCREDYSWKVAVKGIDGSKRPQAQVDHAVTEFVLDHDGLYRTHLLMIYYIGNFKSQEDGSARLYPSNEAYPWLSDSGHEKYDLSVEWSPAERPLSHSEADVLTVFDGFDCCGNVYSGGDIGSLFETNRHPNDGGKNYQSLVTFGPVPAIGEIVGVLRTRQGISFTSEDLTVAIKQNGRFLRLIDQSRGGSRRNIRLLPLLETLNTQSHLNAPPESNLGLHTSQLALGFVIRENPPLTPESIQKLAGGLLQCAEDSGLNIENIEWLGYQPAISTAGKAGVVKAARHWREITMRRRRDRRYSDPSSSISDTADWTRGPPGMLPKPIPSLGKFTKPRRSPSFNFNFNFEDG